MDPVLVRTLCLLCWEQIGITTITGMLTASNKLHKKGQTGQSAKENTQDGWWIVIRVPFLNVAFAAFCVCRNYFGPSGHFLLIQCSTPHEYMVFIL